MNKKLTVCILTAGRGTRMGPIGLNLTKALHPLGDKAIISHIIEKFPKNSEFIIGIGFLGNQIKNYLSMAHEGIKFTYVNVKNYDGPGSGPGHSLYCCKKYLMKPFYFVSCDTLWDNNINLELNSNWLGISKVKTEESQNYCNLKLKNNFVVDVSDKKKVDEKNFRAFVGLCFIYDYQIFWKGLNSKILIDGEHQISNGVKYLIDNTKTRGINIKWTDVGNKEKYENAIKKFTNYDFSKTDEALYILNDKVIKFFVDPNIVKLRYKKSKRNHQVFPHILHTKNQFYSYDYQSGKTLYQLNNEKIFTHLLDWLSKKLWKKSNKNNHSMKKSCLLFYRDKTQERVKLFKQKYPKADKNLKVNNQNVPPISKLMKKIDWENLSNGIARFIHGDLQFDNILYNKKNNNFVLLDWRQDFAGNIDFGDIYYDLSKLYGGIIINYDLIKLNAFNYTENGNEIKYDFEVRKKMLNYKKIFEKFCVKNLYDLKKIRILTSLIYINMAPLHKYPFDKLLFHHGKRMLFDEINYNHE